MSKFEIQNPFTDVQSVTRHQAEYRLQIAVVKHLNSAFPDLLYTHVPNRPANAQDGFFKKMMGVRPGVPDLLFWWTGKTWGTSAKSRYFMECAGIELKASKGKWGNDQNRFASYFTHIGGKYAICKSVKDVHDILKEWGIVPKHDSIVEADIRSDMKKKHDGFEWFKP